MKTIRNNNEHGFAMLLELVLVAGVLAVIGFALYRSNHTTTNTAALVNPQPAATLNTEANATANAAITDSSNEATASAANEAANDEIGATDSDVVNLEASSNESF